MNKLREKRIMKQHQLQRTCFVDDAKEKNGIELLWSLKQQQRGPESDERYWFIQHEKYIKPTLQKISELYYLRAANGEPRDQLSYFTRLAALGFAGADKRRDQLKAYVSCGGDIATLKPGYEYALAVWRK